MMLFAGSQLHLSPEIYEFNQNKEREKEKKNSEISYMQFQFNTFPGHIIYPFFKPEVPFEHMYTFNSLEVL